MQVAGGCLDPEIPRDLSKAPVLGGRAAGADTKCAPKYGGVDSELKRAGGGLPSPTARAPGGWTAEAVDPKAAERRSQSRRPDSGTCPKQTWGAEGASNVGLVLGGASSL